MVDFIQGVQEIYGNVSIFITKASQITLKKTVLGY